MQSPPPLRGRRPGSAAPATGAFAVPTSVGWEEDDFDLRAPELSEGLTQPGGLPVRQVHLTPVAQPAPQFAPPSLVAQPVAQPAPVPVQPVAQQARVFTLPASQTVAQPAPQFAPPAFTQPVVPVFTSVDTANLPAEEPAPTRINDADFILPGWARIKASSDEGPETSSWDTPRTGPAFAITPTVTVDRPEIEPAKPETSRWPTPKNPLTRKAKHAKPVTASKRKPSQSSKNGRGAYLAVRITVGVITAWLVLVGLKHTVVGSTVPTTAEMATQVSEKLGFNGFPRASAEAFATRFATVYLTYAQTGSEGRTKELARYAPTATTLTWGWDGSGTQRVIAGPFTSGDPELLDKNNAIITIAAQVDQGNWVYLAVPVYANNQGAMVVSGPPAYTSAPRLALSPGREAAQDLDSELSTTINPDMAGFFTAWAASDATALSRYTTPDATVSATTGLGGTLTLKELRAMRIPKAGGSTRTGEIDVEWAAPGGGLMLQSYRITLQKLDTGRWFVKDVKAGTISPASNVSVDPSANPTTPTK